MVKYAIILMLSYNILLSVNKEKCYIMIHFFPNIWVNDYKELYKNMTMQLFLKTKRIHLTIESFRFRLSSEILTWSVNSFQKHLFKSKAWAQIKLIDSRTSWVFKCKFTNIKLRGSRPDGWSQRTVSFAKLTHLAS